MADSIAVTITVQNNIIQAYIKNFDIQPRSGIVDFNVHFTGYLSNYPTLDADTDLVNGETIHIQYLNPYNGQWEDTGVYATTQSVWIPDPMQPTGEREIKGHFEGDIGILKTWLLADDVTSRNVQFRAHYDGNSGKGLLGCE